MRIQKHFIQNLLKLEKGFFFIFFSIIVFILFSSNATRISGTVQLAKDARSGESVAIKQMVISKQQTKSGLINEILNMKDNHHANIVNFLGVYLSGKEIWVNFYFCVFGEREEKKVWRERGTFFFHFNIYVTIFKITMEYIDGGCLTDLIFANENLLTEAHIAWICWQVSSSHFLKILSFSLFSEFFFLLGIAWSGVSSFSISPNYPS